MVKIKRRFQPQIKTKYDLFDFIFFNSYLFTISIKTRHLSIFNEQFDLVIQRIVDQLSPEIPSYFRLSKPPSLHDAYEDDPQFYPDELGNLRFHELLFQYAVDDNLILFSKLMLEGDAQIGERIGLAHGGQKVVEYLLSRPDLDQSILLDAIRSQINSKCPAVAFAIINKLHTTPRREPNLKNDADDDIFKLLLSKSCDALAALSVLDMLLKGTNPEIRARFLFERLNEVGIKHGATIPSAFFETAGRTHLKRHFVRAVLEEDNEVFFFMLSRLGGYFQDFGLLDAIDEFRDQSNLTQGPKGSISDEAWTGATFYWLISARGTAGMRAWLNSLAD